MSSQDVTLAVSGRWVRKVTLYGSEGGVPPILLHFYDHGTKKPLIGDVGTLVGMYEVQADGSQKALGPMFCT